MGRVFFKGINQVSNQLYEYIPHGFHFGKPPPSELTLYKRFCGICPQNWPGTIWKNKKTKKELVNNGTTFTFKKYLNDSDFFKYSKPTDSLILIFKIPRICSSLKNQMLGPHWNIPYEYWFFHSLKGEWISWMFCSVWSIGNSKGYSYINGHFKTK